MTLAEIKLAQKTGDVPVSKKKQMVRIPSKQTREQCYENSARAMESKEEQIMPTYGGRPWRVVCRFTEPNTRQKPPLFRWFRGKLELAVLPHFLGKVPEPMQSRGLARLEEEDEEGFYNASTDLCERAESQFSRLAWNDGEHMTPTMNLKWLSPNHNRFSSRKSAEEEAKKLAEQQLFVDKIVFGYGARGQKLHPRKPSKTDALKAGKLRFLRDGLWVVGQEESWQKDRAVEIERENKRRKLENDEKVIRPKPAPSAPKSPLQLFVKTQRIRYRDVILENLRDIEEKPQFTLVDADRELRELWKNDMTKDEQQLWKDLLDGKEPNWTVKEGLSGDDNVEAKKEDLTAVNVTGEKQPAGGVIRPIMANEVKHVSADAQNDTKKLITGLDIYIRECREDLRCQKVAHKAQEEIGPSLSAADGYTLAQAEDDLRQMWVQLKSSDKQEWEDRANERNDLSDVVVVSPGDSEEEAEESKAHQRDVNKSHQDKKSEEEAQNESLAQNSYPNEHMEEVAVPEKSPDNNETNEAQADTAVKVVVDPNVRRSGRAKAKRRMEIEDQPAPEKPKAPHVPSIWAIPVEQTRTPDAEQTEESKPVVVQAEAKKLAPKRKRSECPPKQISQSAHWRLSNKQITMCHDAATEHFEKVMYTVKARALFGELSDGFDLLRERGRGRYDMELPAFDEPSFSFLTDFAKTPWMGVVRQILGDDVVLIHKGVFLSNPGAEAQEYHQDGPHLTTQNQRPCHAINVFVPLVDLTLRNGPTEFVVGSHILDCDGYDRDNVVTPGVPAGTPIIFDYRLGHRGLANTSTICRPIVYCTYAAVANGKEFRDSVNFSRKRYHRLGELVEKPLSRDERRKIRETSQEERECLKAVEEMETASEEVKPTPSPSAITGQIESAGQAQSQASVPPSGGSVQPQLLASQTAKTVGNNVACGTGAD